MAKHPQETGPLSKTRNDSEPKLKGTLVSVMGVGVVMIAMWAAAYIMYAAR
ncbi:cytochrome C oxidase subunit II [Siminovitchia sediminis]|uniref:Cytochrome C oxidase subunit II n=1 Tax=Siminovitchia sediminis TaxID=1274353 RepID=A0ABW4KDY5_9BACI